MEQQNAIDLWNEVLMNSATSCVRSSFYYAVKHIGAIQTTNERTEAAAFLRMWADALEGKHDAD